MTYVTIKRVIAIKRENITEQHIKYLNQFGLEGLNPERLALETYQKGEFLTHEGEPIESLLFIIHGEVRVSVTGENGKSLLICFYSTDQIIGNMELMANIPAAATCEAISEVTCVAVPMDFYEQALRSNLYFVNFVGSRIAEMLAQSSRNNALNILYPLKTRVCSYIAVMQQDGVFTAPLTETSELLGSSYRHLLRTLNELCQDGVLQKTKGGYLIKDEAKLESTAADYYIP